MPVMDLNNLYDVLLGHDWLHAVKAIAYYDKNQYMISWKGKSATLQGRLYTQRKVELPHDSDTTESTSSVSDDSNDDESDSSSSESESAKEVTQAFMTLCVN